MKSKKHFDIPEDGQLTAFDKRFFYRLSFPDLFADLLLIVFSFFASHHLFAKEGLFYHLQPWQNVAMYSIVTLTVPWYLGYIYVRNAAYYRKPVMRIFLWSFILMTLMILIRLMQLVFMENIEGDRLSGIDGFAAGFALFLLVLGPMMCIGGAMQAREEFSDDGKDKLKFDPYKLSGGPGAFFIIVLAVAFMIYFIGLLPADAGPGWFLLAFLGGPFGAVIAFALYIFFLQFLDKMGVYKYLRLIAVNTFPFFIIAVLVFWSGVAIYFMLNDFGNTTGKISKGALIFSVCVSGLVPFRVLMLFNAPVRMINLALGVVALSYFLFQMVQLVG